MDSLLFQSAMIPSRAGLIWGHIMKEDTLEWPDSCQDRSRIPELFRNDLKQSLEMYNIFLANGKTLFLGDSWYSFAPAEQ